MSGTAISSMDDSEKARMRAKDECMQNMLTKPYPTDGRLYCNRTWDKWGCWDDTPAATTAYIQCPSHQTGFDPNLRAYKHCTENGTWWKHPMTNKEWANYTSCVNMGDLETDKRLIWIFVGGYSISCIVLITSLFIFFYFRQLQCDRVTIHKNLFFSYILNGTVWILYYLLAILDGEVLSKNPIWCQALHVITQYFVACNFFWMFCEGFYLHTIIVVAFMKGKKLILGCHIMGWCFPILTTIIYSITRGLMPSERVECWKDESPLQWIVLAPIIFTQVMNFAFLCNIVRVLITKLRAVNSPDTNQTRKAVRATLILIPLLGLQYIILPFRPNDDSDLLNAYLHISAFVTSFQGLFVAFIFCFFNGEVIAVLKRKWGQHRLMHGNGHGRNSTMYTHTTMTIADANSVIPPKSPFDTRIKAANNKQKTKSEYVSLTEQKAKPEWNNSVV